MAQDPLCGMKVNEKSALKVEHKGETFYFCSRNCLEKFARQNKLPQQEVAACLALPKAPFYKNKSLIVAGVLVLLSLGSTILPFLVPFRQALGAYLKIIWWAVLLGLVLGGVIDRYVPREYISHVLAQPKRKTIYHAVFLGFLMSACSHGILALTIQLHKKGASTPAVVAFLLASPWANLTLTLVLISFFKAKAFFIIISAIVIATITGLIYQFLEKKNLVEANVNTAQVDENFSIKEDIRKRFRGYKVSLGTIKSDIKGVVNGTVSLSNMVLWWILIGVGLASLIGAYVPTDFFHHYMGPTFLGLLVTLFVATIIEVCSEGSAPMAFEIYKQTGALGNSFVFLMAGVVTDYTEIGLLWHNVGRKTALWLPVVTVPQVVLLGWLFNQIR
ncbi:MAG: permease [Candidatus Omnitrophota bacterium]